MVKKQIAAHLISQQSSPPSDVVSLGQASDQKSVYSELSLTITTCQNPWQIAPSNTCPKV